MNFGQRRNELVLNFELKFQQNEKSPEAMERLWRSCTNLDAVQLRLNDSDFLSKKPQLRSLFEAPLSDPLSAAAVASSSEPPASSSSDENLRDLELYLRHQVTPSTTKDEIIDWIEVKMIFIYKFHKIIQFRVFSHYCLVTIQLTITYLTYCLANSIHIIKNQCIATSVTTIAYIIRSPLSYNRYNYLAFLTNFDLFGELFFNQCNNHYT